MTYLNPTPPNTSTPKKHSAVSRAMRDHPDYVSGPRDIESPEGLRRQYSKLYDRFDGLAPDETTDHFCRLSSALNATRKCFYETSERQARIEADMAASAQSTQASAEQRAQKIRDICEMVSQLSLKDFDKKKLRRRAKKARAKTHKKRDKTPQSGGGHDPHTVN